MNPSQRLITWRRFGFVYAVAVSAIFLAVWWRLSGLAAQYPYHFVWDQLLLTAQDTLLIHSGLTPDTFSHPGFGMYLLLVWSQRIAHFLGALSILSLDELAQSLNPLLVMAEFTIYTRNHGMFLAMGTIFFLWAGITIGFRLAPLWSLAVLVLLATQESVAYAAVQGRSELYSVFFWSMGLFFGSLAMRRKQGAWRDVLFAITGVFLGLAFFTKIQAVFWVIAFGFLVGLMHQAKEQEDYDEGISNKRIASALVLAALTLISTCGGLAWATMYSLPEGKSQWANAATITPQLVLWLALLIALVATTALAYRRNIAGPFASIGIAASFVVFGFWGSLFLHHVLYGPAGPGLEHLGYTVRMAFLNGGYNDRVSVGRASHDFREFVRYYPLLFMVCALSFLTFVISSNRRKQSRLPILCGIALVFVLGTNNTLGARFILRDYLWIEVLTVISLLAFLFAAMTLWKADGGIIRGIAAAVIALLAVANIERNADVAARIDGTVNRFGYHYEHWLTNIWDHNQRRYAEIMLARIEPPAELAPIFGQFHPLEGPGELAGVRQAAFPAHRQALDWQRIKKVNRTIFKNTNVPLTRVGLVWNDFPVWTNALDWRITGFPESLRGAIVVDLVSAPTEREHFYKREYVTSGGGHYFMDKFADVPAGDAFVVLGRPDYRILLFVPRGALPGARHGAILPAAETIVLKKGAEDMPMNAAEITNYAELERRELPDRHFFVLQQRKVADWGWVE